MGIVTMGIGCLIPIFHSLCDTIIILLISYLALCVVCNTYVSFLYFMCLY